MKKFIVFTLFITILLASIIYAAFNWGGEFISTVVADIIPFEIQKKLGESTIQSMDLGELEPTSLPVFTQNKIKEKFFKLYNTDSSKITLLFRNASYPNAFALPGNYIIILDSLVKLSEDTTNYTDVMGVLAHEAGHLHYKHSLKLMIKSGLTAAVIGYIIGDFSSFVATLTHQLLSLSYSRSYESEADDYAIQLLKTHHLSTTPLANLLEKISQKSGTENIPEFLSSHPVTEERVKKLREEK